MTNEILQEIACPNCLNAIDVREHGRYVVCDACNSQFILEGHICPGCTTYHKIETPFCRQCGEALTRKCQRCHTSNWAGDEYCNDCGAPLDIFELLHINTRHKTEHRLNEQMRRSRQIKIEEEEASKQRLAKMIAEEETRQADIRQRQQKHQAREHLLLLWFGVIVLFFLSILAVVSFIL